MEHAASPPPTCRSTRLITEHVAVLERLSHQGTPARCRLAHELGDDLARLLVGALSETLPPRAGLRI
jgi:hypothetical protein